MAEQEPAQLLARPAKRAHRRLPGPDQVAHRLVIGIGHPNRRQLAAPVQLGQAQRVASVGLDPIAWAPGNERRRHHHTVMAKRCQLPMNAVTAGAGLVAKTKPPTLPT